jgi:RNA polymerase sigma-70 factor (ECF subfamily)
LLSPASGLAGGRSGENAAVNDNGGVDPRPRAGANPTTEIQDNAAAGEERILVDAILQHDRKAAARLVAMHADAIYSYARYRLAARTDLVEDVVQDVFLVALNGLARFRGESSLRTWLIAIARHKIDDVYRQRLREPTDGSELEGGEPPADGPPLDEVIDTARTRAKARRVLARMPERYSMLLLWRYWEQRSTRDMATAIGTTEKSVERMLARARARFKELWLKE